MPRVLLTGASGFIAAHVLDLLLQYGYSVRGTVRSQEKADKLAQEHSRFKNQLDFVVVPDIASPGAFDEAVVSDTPFDAVLHTASPFHFQVTDPESQLLQPAIQGTKGILESVFQHAPSVKRIVITSSFASIIHPERGSWPDKVYSEDDWNPITYEEGLRDPPSGYRASKKLAEQAAWDFVANNATNFDIVTINPPLVVGPIKPYLQSLESINTSNERVLSIVTGKSKDGLPPTGTYLWVDVRDVAEAHVNALLKPSAGGKRFFVVAGRFSNFQIASIIKKRYPQLRDRLPSVDEPNDGFPEGGVYDADNSRSKDILGLNYKTLEQSVTDLVDVLLKMGA